MVGVRLFCKFLRGGGVLWGDSTGWVGGGYWKKSLELARRRVWREGCGRFAVSAEFGVAGKKKGRLAETEGVASPVFFTLEISNPNSVTDTPPFG